MRAADTLEFLVRHLVDEPDDVEIVVVEDDQPTTLEVHVAADDVGKVIGRRGRTAKALRTVVRAAAELDGEDVQVDIVD